ncbi:hypothetical protein [Nitratifractor sp.]
MKVERFRKMIGALGLSLAVSGLLFAESGEFGSQKFTESMHRAMFTKAVQPTAASCFNSPFKIGKGHLESQVGDIVKIGNKRYMIEAFPFIDYGTGDHYYLKVPVAILKNGKDSYYMYFNYATMYNNAKSTCYRFRLNGYPSINNQIIYEEYFSFSKNKFGAKVDEGLTYFNSASFGTTVKVGKTDLYFYALMEGSMNKAHSRDADYSDDIEWSKLTAKRQLVNNIRKWVKYVEIVKMP